MDITGMIIRERDDTLKAARDAERVGQFAKAAGLYQKAATLQRQYADKLGSPTAKAEARASADQLAARAQTMLTNPPRPRPVVVGPSGPSGMPPAPIGAPDSGGEQTAMSGDEQALRSTVEGLITKGSHVSWDDIAGLEEAKREVKMAFALAFAEAPTDSHGRKVELFSWQRILLYGPPGTGKTMLAAAVAGQIPGATFFDANWSGLASKWFGESERLIQLLYVTAKERSPSVVFLDEVDAMAANRETGSESGAAKKVLTAFLTALEGVSDKLDPPFVLTFAATNRPWSLDAAFLSRMAKAIYIPLPDEAARKHIFALQLERKGYEVSADYDDLARLTDGYSGRDLSNVCKQLIVNMVYEQNPHLTEVVDQGIDALKQYHIVIRPVTKADVERALHQVRPTVTPQNVAMYDQWRQSMGY